ncbi:beta-lactamase [Planctopirus limnophila DSM 3776]|uniref:Beta-lactamase n=1 Tax=Planctopirus limnophila (strain ATCC 43296 / DSM 3776 / IFAM 1008 / Mu 290) TaxID=521674 RepID=D5STP1_PLAL2|nr:serine hydrolase domain-containing protein [Planctopirus limnophila]ADG69070.1 beta-lactamase [Planctopirus limnophila DSM 3776]
MKKSLTLLIAILWSSAADLTWAQSVPTDNASPITPSATTTATATGTARAAETWEIAAPDFLPLSQKISASLNQAIERGEIPGAVVIAGTLDETLLHGAVGDRILSPEKIPLRPGDVFDLASLTKPLATSLAVMKLVDHGKLELDQPVAKYWPEFKQNGKEAITSIDLLVHRSGLIADNALADYAQGPEVAWQKMANLPLRQPAGTRFVYSDVGLMVMGRVVEKISGKSLAEFCAQELYQPLALKRTRYLPSAAWADQLVPTEGPIGTVHDPRAARLGGVAGHAGLFSDAQGIAVLSRAILVSLQNKDSSAANMPRIFTPVTARLMVTPVEVPAISSNTPTTVHRALGWDMRSTYSSNRPTKMSDSAFGHGGFTGTSLWIDPQRKLFVCILSSRLYPDGKGVINPLAREIGDLIVEQFDARTTRPTPETPQ